MLDLHDDKRKTKNMKAKRFMNAAYKADRQVLQLFHRVTEFRVAGGSGR